MSAVIRCNKTQQLVFTKTKCLFVDGQNASELGNYMLILRRAPCPFVELLHEIIVTFGGTVREILVPF
jgi:hypothetical protein